MKVFLLAFVIVYEAIGNASAISESELRDIADNLNIKIHDLETSVDIVKSNIKKVTKDLDKKKNVQDFGISQNPLFIQTGEELEKSKSNRNYIVCRNLKKNNEDNLKQELKDMFSYEVNTRLKQIESDVTQISKDISELSEHMRGANLEAEIKVCVNEESKCKILNDYTIETNIMEKTLQILNKVLLTLIEAVLKTKIYPNVSKKIKIQISEPITRCLKHVD